jgi:hypothetical protein
MIRTVYVPLSEKVEAGENLAVEHQIPITHGRAEFFQDLDFDETKVQVLHIPEIKQGSQSAQSIRAGFIFGALYEDEFLDLTNLDCYLEYSYENSEEKIKIKPNIKEKHMISFSIRPEEKGTIIYNIFVSENVVYSNMFGVL